MRTGFQPRRPFVPLRRNPHVLSILANFWPRQLDTRRFPVRELIHATEPGVGVVVQSQEPAGPAPGEMILLHGLEGSGEAGYMRSLAHAGLLAGRAVHRFHMRTCGKNAPPCPTLYHAGLTSDLLHVLRRHREAGRAAAHLVGFSLGGNVVLKLAGELGDAAHDLIASVCAVSTPLDLATCARRIGEPVNRIYELRFLLRMRRRAAATGRYPRERLRRARSLYLFDDLFTAPGFGLGSADGYYRTQSARNFLDRIRVPTLLLQAKDDMFIPFDVFEHPAVRQNPRVELVAPDHGGHVGFLARSHPRFWSDEVVLDWIARH